MVTFGYCQTKGRDYKMPIEKTELNNTPAETLEQPADDNV